jgi:hypothetical protein
MQAIEALCLQDLTPKIGVIEMFENNELLDSLWFRCGVHTVAFWSWVAVCCLLLAVR